MALNEQQLAQVAELKRLAGDDLDMDDEELYQILTTSAGLNAAAAEVWRRKAVSYAGLIDVTEGSSKRSLSQLSSQALALQKMFAASAAAEVVEVTRGSSYSRAIVRA